MQYLAPYKHYQRGSIWNQISENFWSIRDWISGEKKHNLDFSTKIAKSGSKVWLMNKLTRVDIVKIESLFYWFFSRFSFVKVGYSVHQDSSNKISDTEF
jgi:hypothetical protein